MIPRLDPPGLLIHDKTDRDVSYTQSVALAEQWLQSRLILTEGLGHRRILRDEGVIAEIVNFINAGSDALSTPADRIVRKDLVDG